MGIPDIKMGETRMKAEEMQKSIRNMYVMLSTDENMGDVIDTLIYFAPKLGLGEVRPELNGREDRYCWPWEEEAE